MAFNKSSPAPPLPPPPPPPPTFAAGNSEEGDAREANFKDPVLSRESRVRAQPSQIVPDRAFRALLLLLPPLSQRAITNLET